MTKIIFHKLSAYAQYHFQEEENLMILEGVDSRLFDLQVEDHQNFINDITAMGADIDSNDYPVAKQLLKFLTHWLVCHILGSDKKMASQIHAIRSGSDPKAVFDAMKMAHDSATEPLLAALNGLFQLVSARNKELTQLNQLLEKKVEDRTKELLVANRHLETIALTDILTGLPNRRHGVLRLSKLWEESLEAGEPLVCMMIDADHFKEVNDTHGHDAGDRVLFELAQTLSHTVRTDDIACRLGGDEFFIICPNTDIKGGLHIAETIRKTVSELRVPTGDSVWHGSISIGVAEKTLKMKSHGELIKAADEGVYAAKRNGKNCVRSAMPPV